MAARNFMVNPKKGECRIPEMLGSDTVPCKASLLGRENVRKKMGSQVTESAHYHRGVPRLRL